MVLLGDVGSAGELDFDATYVVASFNKRIITFTCASGS